MGSSVRRNQFESFTRWLRLAIGTMVASLPASAERLLVGNQTYYYDGTNYYQPCYGGSDTDYCVVSDPNQQGKKVDEFSAVGLKVKRSFFLVLAVAGAAFLAGCAAAPPVQQQGPNKPIPWRSIYTVESDGEVGWHS